jgi:hypothetical protein
MLYFLIGLFGSLAMGINNEAKKIFNENFSLFRTVNKSKEKDENLERAMAMFFFASLLSGLLYIDSPNVRFPMFNHALLVVFVHTSMFFYNCVVRRVAKKKWKQNSSPIIMMANNKNDNTKIIRDVNNNKSLEEEAEEEEKKFDGPVPTNFVSTCNGDISKAKKMFAKSLVWRKKNKLHEIFETPMKNFNEILMYYPHAIHGFFFF